MAYKKWQLHRELIWVVGLLLCKAQEIFNDTSSPRSKVEPTCSLAGGLGNQLFELFAVLAYSAAYNDTSVVLPYSDNLGNRPTYWSSFFRDITPLTTKFAEGGFEKANARLSSFTEWKQGCCCCFNPLPKPTRNVILRGYFQSYRYFGGYSERIFEMMGTRRLQREARVEFQRYFAAHPSAVLTADSNATLRTLATSPITVSLHFRLGDYKNNTLYHPLQKNHYYHHVLQTLQNETRAENRTLRVLYFCETEDVEQVISRVKELSIYFPVPHVEFVRVDDTIPDWKQMLIMSLCDDNIIANSTFSCWAAFLNLGPMKRVFYPAVWFGPVGPKVNEKDFFPEGWVKLE